MSKQRVLPGTRKLRVPVRACAACVGAAVLAIGLALVAMTALIFLLGLVGASEANPAPHTVSSAVQDAELSFYLAQLVGVSFFNHTAELRFAAIPALLIVGAAIITAAIVAVRLMPGSARRKMNVALAMPVSYALLVGLAGNLIPPHFSARGFGAGILVSPSPVEAFLLPLGWGFLFAWVGGLIGVFGRDWRKEATRVLGAWAAPLVTSLRVLTVSLTISAAAALLGGFVLTGGNLRLLTGGDLGRGIMALGGAILALPSLAAAVLVSGFGVPFGWQVDALSQGHGSISAFGGTTPSSGASLSHVQAAPGVLAFAPILAVITVFAVGWLSARRSGPDVRLCIGNALRAGTVLTLAVWLLGLLARIDAQAGGLLGFHFAPDTLSLLWHVPLWSSLGCLAGSLAFVLVQGRSSRRRLAAAFAAAVHPSRLWLKRPARADRAPQGLAWRAALGTAFASVPALIVGIGGAGAITPSGAPEPSYAPVIQEAEQRLERDSSPGETVAVTVSPTTRAVSTASVHIPLKAVGATPDEPPAEQAKAALAHYGNLFGLSKPSELGQSSTVTDKLGMTNVYFHQMADGLPVYGGSISVSFSRNDEYLTWAAGSVIPEVSVAESEAKLLREQAVAVAEQALPSGSLAQPASLQVYAGRPPYISGPRARLAWFVWLIGEKGHVSNEYVIDAVTGKILDVIPKTDFSLYREVFTAKEQPVLPGTLVRKEGDAPSADEDVNHAYDYTGDVYKFYEEKLERRSYDNNDAPLRSTVHYAEAAGVPFQNAFWNGKQMVFGNKYASALDVVGHELTHGVTQYTSELVEEGQSGALNESFSDMMGESVEYFATGKTDWEMGESLPIGAIRSLWEPNLYQEMLGSGDEHHDPKTLSEWDPTCKDGGGVHINSTITSHAYYLVASKLGIETAQLIFYRGFAEKLKGNPTATLEDARAAVLQATKEYFGEGSAEYETVKTVFNEVGLNGTAQPPACSEAPQCSFARALKDEEDANGASSTVEMLATLYKARGELAQPSLAGKHFLPLYEEHMGRITELTSEDPQLEETSVSGLREITPALNGLMEGEGAKFELSAEEMAKIEAALRRLAQDDRMFSGDNAGELADLIEEELRWLHLPSYGHMTYVEGWHRLNKEVEMNTTTLEGSSLVVDPNCTGKPYTNAFQINGFYVDTPNHYIPGQVSPFNAGGVACGTSVEAVGEPNECHGKESLNTKMTVELPPGDKVNSTKNLANGSWVGEAIGRAIACAGRESRVIYGGAALRSLSSWTSSQCPTTAIACYEGTSTYEGHTGHSYASVSEEAGKLTLTTSPIQVTVEGVEIPVGFGEFGVELCARAGEPGTKSCGGATAPWIHQNGEAAEPGCPTSKGRYVAKATNSAGKSTLTVQDCLRWEPEAHMQIIDAGASLNAVSCIPGTTDCIASDSKGGALYSTNVSASAASTWTSWAGPSGQSPSEAVACPATTLCLLADGSVSGGGGNLYHASSLGGAFSTSFLPSNGVNAVSCPSTSFCVTTQEGGGFIRYSTNPSGISWTSLSIGTGAMKGVSCLSASFCAVVDGTGNVHVATTEAKVKEAGGWTATNIDGTKALKGISCTSTTSCLAVDGSGEVLKLAIEASGKATVTKQALEGAKELTAVTCTGSTCVAVDNEGSIFDSSNAGSSWTNPYGAGAKLTSVSCASVWLCAAVTSSGDIATFNPAAVPPSRTQSIDSGNSLNAASCISGTTDCVASDSKGNAFYSTNVNTRTNATWNTWSGPTGQSPSEAVACPSTTLCLLADGAVTGGGNLYYATSLGGAFSEAFSPTSGVDAISCASVSFCVTAQGGGGSIRYSTSPAGTSWTSLTIGSGAMKGVNCLSASFCAVVDGTGNVHVATTEAKVKEAAGWTATNIDGTKALNGIACTSTTLCLAVDGEGNVLRLTIDSKGGATASKRNIDGTKALTAVTCTTNSTCVVVDNQGSVFASESAGESWVKQHALGVGLTSVSCASNSLCLATDTSGEVTAFDTR
jgi:Zn-dependent metalloprotease